MNLVDSFADVSRFVRLRRDIHAHPELGFEEHRTSEIVAGLLREWGIEVHTGVAGTGVVGVLKCGDGAGPSACAPTSTRCHCKRKTISPTAPRTTGACTRAGTTATPPCCWRRPGTWRRPATSAAR
jgi:hypothetical protein